MPCILALLFCMMSQSQCLTELYYGDLRLSGSMIRKSRFIFTKERRTIRQKRGCLNHSNERIFQVYLQMQGQIKDFWKWGPYHDMYNGVGVRFADFVCLFDLILYVPSTIFQLYRDRSSWVGPVLS